MLTRPSTELQRVFDLQRQAFRGDINPSAAIRRNRLTRLLQMTQVHGGAIVAAVSADFGHRSIHETRMADLMVVEASIRHACRHLQRWMKDQRLPTGWSFRPGWNRLLRQPLGVVGVVAPWNFPYQLAIGPAVGAIAAGNRVMIKPSELTPRFGELLTHIVAETFADDELAVVNGDAAVAETFVSLPFDHLLFTGSTHIGRLVAQAAARNLTPVTLELGGKSPVIVDDSADLGLAAARLAYAKLLNAGQTCVAPDYVLVPEGRQGELVTGITAAVTRMYPRLLANPDYTGIISDRHFVRLQALLEDARAKGARVIEVNPAKEDAAPNWRKLPPTLVLGATDDMTVMQEEIFGPILPILTYRQLDDAIRHIGERERPLALYWFGRDKSRCERVLRETIAGGVTVNDCLWHLAQEDAPFGGVGASGYGAYHGEYGFRTFSKEKPVFYQTKLNAQALLRPPYGKIFDAVLAVAKKIS